MQALRPLSGRAKCFKPNRRWRYRGKTDQRDTLTWRVKARTAKRRIPGPGVGSEAPTSGIEVSVCVAWAGAGHVQSAQAPRVQGNARACRFGVTEPVADPHAIRAQSHMPPAWQRCAGAVVQATLGGARMAAIGSAHEAREPLLAPNGVAFGCGAGRWWWCFSLLYYSRKSDREDGGVLGRSDEVDRVEWASFAESGSCQKRGRMSRSRYAV